MDFSRVNGGLTGGSCTFNFRYAVKKNGPRPCSVNIDGKIVGFLSFPKTGSDSKWENESLQTTCLPGMNAVRLAAHTKNGGPYVDRLVVGPSEYSPTSLPTHAPPSPSGTITGVHYGLYEGEDSANMFGNSSVKSNADGFTGNGFVEMGGRGSWMDFSHVNGGLTGGSCTFNFRYAVKKNGPRSCKVFINGIKVGFLQFPRTGSDSNWEYQTLKTTCLPGMNVVRLKSSTKNGGPSVDNLVVEP